MSHFTPNATIIRPQLLVQTSPCQTKETAHSPEDNGGNGRSALGGLLGRVRLQEHGYVEPGARIERPVGHQEGQVLVGLELLVGGPVRREGHLAERRHRLYLHLGLAERGRTRVEDVRAARCVVGAATRLQDRVRQLHYPRQGLGTEVLLGYHWIPHGG